MGTGQEVLPVGDPLGVHLAVVACKETQDPTQPLDMATPVFYGTAFVIAPGLLATAAHVVNNARAAGPRLGIMQFKNAEPRSITGFLVKDVETFPGIDLALLLCSAPAAPILPFEFAPLPFFEQIQSIGFPLSLDPERMVFEVRGFQGHIVTRREFFRLPGQPPIYELSFGPQPGLSGAPLLVYRQGRPHIVGMVIEHDTIEAGGVKVHLGVALDAQEFLRVRSRILGASLAEAIFRREMLPARKQTPIRNM
jgi:hypothetical protein